MHTEEDPQLKRRTEDNGSTDNESVLQLALPPWDTDLRNLVRERPLTKVIKASSCRRMPTMHTTSGNQLHTEEEICYSMIRSQAHNDNEDDNYDKIS